ncbi:Nucleotide-binding universal stress protein, UspA family [Psychrobacillus psychrotolerans]|uniref:Universal stress protein n=1 Tax=Psychrobacillus psychrotolerans TaxID=126156 RepID=A0A1I5XLM1_9BACI|nr:universal stress protein [Psychrobacillus psychrotolerans]SFQ32607.1 Nucleotide-binding universal stress protein, UspA family [Psychrobacillus psychrotolerans]
MENQYNSIIVAVDGSKEAEYAFRKSIDIAYRNEGAQLHIVNIIDTRYFGAFDQEVAEEVKEQSREILDRYKARSIAARVENVNIIIEYGSPKTVITKEIAKSVEADLIICGATGHTPVERYLIGSVSEAIVRSAKCDVLVIRTPGSTI